jgi:hypothetical protein
VVAKHGSHRARAPSSSVAEKVRRTAQDQEERTMRMHPTVKELRRTQRRYERARDRAILLQQERDTAVRDAIAEGFTFERIVQAVDGKISRGRVGQIATHRR